MSSPDGVSAIDRHGQRVQAMFDSIAPGYDRANRLMSAGTDVRWRRRAVASLLADPCSEPVTEAWTEDAASVGPSRQKEAWTEDAASVGPSRQKEARYDPNTGAGASILDLCAGTLDSTLEIHRRYPEATLIAGDFSPGMLATGRARVAELGIETITAIPMDAHELPLADASVDALFCAFGARNLSDLERACVEQLRVLRPGGQLVVLEFFRPQRALTRAFHAVYNHTVLPVVGWACTGNLDAYLYLPRSIGAFRSADAFVDLLARVGFVDARVTPLTLGVASIVRATKPVRASKPGSLA